MYVWFGSVSRFSFNPVIIQYGQRCWFELTADIYIYIYTDLICIRKIGPKKDHNNASNEGYISALERIFELKAVKEMTYSVCIIYLVTRPLGH